MAGDFSACLRTVTTRVTTMGFEPPVQPEVLVAEDRPAFFVALGFVKNEVSDAEGRTIVSDIICGVGWKRSRGRVSWKHTRYPDMITGHGVSGPFLSHSTLISACCLASQNLQEMGHEDGAVVELKKKMKSKKEKGEYMRPIFCSSRSALNAKISGADHEVKQAESEFPTTQDDGHTSEVKEKKKKKKGKAKDSEEIVAPQVEDTPGL